MVEIDNTTISVKGQPVIADIIRVGDNDIFVTGGFFRVARIRGEGWLENADVDNASTIVSVIKNLHYSVDWFTFGQMPPNCEPKHDFHLEWDNYAVLPITTFENWWTKQINDKTRNMVRRAQKKGVETKQCDFNDALVLGIYNIYNETPIRQGKRFWHYGKDLDTVRKDNSSYLERSTFIGAYCGKDLIGFIKLVFMEDVAAIMQILSLTKERDKATNNALIAKCVELCAQKQVRYLIYSQFTYGKKGVDPLAEFKKHNAFQKMIVPRYYIPLTLKGRLAIKLGLHHGLDSILPKQMAAGFRQIRAKWYDWNIKPLI